MKSTVALRVACVVACGIASMVASADEDGPVQKINAEAANALVNTAALRGGLSVLSGSGGNITVLDGKEGKLLVDAGISVSRARVAKALAGISSSPVKFVIDTHYHWDHMDGNAWLHDAGATIIAHKNTLKRASTATRVDDWKFTFPPYPPGARPTVIVDMQKKMTFDETEVEIHYYDPCHTDTDLSVYFKSANVLSTGDTFWNHAFPFIDNENGGSIDGMIRAADDNIKRADTNTIVVPGHGPIGNRAQLVEFRDMLVAVRKNVADLKAKGLSREQVIAARPTAAFDEMWGQFVIDGAFFAKLVFDGL